MIKQNNNQVKAGAVISYVQMAVHIIVSLVYTPVMIRLLGQSEYGLYNTASSTIAMLGLLRFGFNNSYIRYYAKYRKNNDKESIERLNGLFIIVFCIIGLVSLACGLIISNNLQFVFAGGLSADEYETAKILMIILTLSLSVSFPMSVFSSILSAHEQFVFLKCVEIIKTIIGPLVTIPLLLAGYKSVCMVTITFILSLLIDACYIYYTLYVLKEKFVFRDFEKGLLLSMIRYTSFIALEMIIDQINWNVDKVIIARYRGTTSVAVYSVGYALYTYYQMFSTSVSGVFIPRIHKIVNESPTNHELKDNLTKIFTKVGRIQFIILGLIATGIVFFGRFFITHIWADKSYSDSFYVALLLILPASIALIQNLGIEIQRAQNKHQFRSIAYSIMAIVNLGVSIILCKLYGAIGSAIGTSISLILANGIIMNIYYQKKCNINIYLFWKNIIMLMRGLAIPILVGIVFTRFVSYDSVIIYFMYVAIYATIYCFSIWFFGMNEYEKKLVHSLLRKVVRK